MVEKQADVHGGSKASVDMQIKELKRWVDRKNLRLCHWKSQSQRQNHTDGGGRRLRVVSSVVERETMRCKNGLKKMLKALLGFSGGRLPARNTAEKVEKRRRKKRKAESGK